MIPLNDDIIAQLEIRLAKALPGKKAHLVMAPSFRPADSNKISAPRAGVLIFLYQGLGGLHTVFMKRPEYTGVHSGQISFPGGKEEPTDTSIVHTALRETQEEIGVSMDIIRVLGSLTPLYIPVSETEVYPSVGISSQKPVFKTDAHEVEYLIEARLDELLDPSIIKIKPYASGKFNGDIPYFEVHNHHIWGATAMILNEFLEILRTIKESRE